MDGSMTNIFVSSDETKVIGGTANVKVDVDFGPQGDRGNLFLVGYGDPNTVSHSVTLQPLDLYINVQTTDEDYLVVYQYVSNPGGNTWVETSKLMTDKFSTNRTVNFIDGQIDNLEDQKVEFKVSNIVPMSLVGGLTAADFNVQCTILNANPVASSIVVSDITIQAGTDDLILPVQVNAVEYSGGNWTPLEGRKTIHFLISVASSYGGII
jgi:hypothetical protein